MRHLFIFLIFLFSAVAANAQYASRELVQKGSRVFLDEEKLASTDLKSLEGFDYETYQEGKKATAAGITTMSFGAASCVVAIVGLIEMQPQAGQPSSGTAGMAVIIGGSLTVLLEAVGIPLYVGGKKKIKAAVDKYNGGTVSLSLGPCRDGFGLALNF